MPTNAYTTEESNGTQTDSAGLPGQALSDTVREGVERGQIQSEYPLEVVRALATVRRQRTQARRCQRGRLLCQLREYPVGERLHQALDAGR